MIHVRVATTHRRERCPMPLIVRGVRLTMQGEGYRHGTIGVVCVSDGVLRRMNRRYLRHDCTTDVLSFPLGEGDAVEGELYVSLDRARVQARRFGVSPSHELVRLVVHGTLHLIGYDDGTAADRARMRKREDHILVRMFGASGRKGIA